MKVPAAGEDQTFIVFGAVDYATGQVIWKVSERKGEEVAITSALLSAVYRDGAPERGASFKPVNPGH